jgi:hypothetical protein
MVHVGQLGQEQRDAGSTVGGSSLRAIEPIASPDCMAQTADLRLDKLANWRAITGRGENERVNICKLLCDIGMAIRRRLN